MSRIAADSARMQYVYDFAALDAVPAGPTSAKVTARRLLSGPTLATGKSSTVGAVLSGCHIILTLGTQARGTGANAHTHPNEQFNYIVQGTMTGEQGGERIFAQRGAILHTPGGLVHTGLACPDEDLVFLALKDTRHGITGPSVNGKYEGPNYLPGFGTRAGERRKSTAELIAESGRDPQGAKTRYVYDFPRLEAIPGRAASAVVTPQVIPAGSDAKGGFLTGEKLHVAVLRYPRGGKSRLLSRPNEQFTFVVEGALKAEVAGEEFRVRRHCIVHVPPGVSHRLVADGREDALVVTCQDARYAFTI
ncbi:MAG: cupin domain-containing protein [Burkholderiales bacterium]|nr:cupin domain-containing protein [Burkholderiales bacterium]